MLLLEFTEAWIVPLVGVHWPPDGAPVARFPAHAGPTIGASHEVWPVAIDVCDTRPS